MVYHCVFPTHQFGHRIHEVTLGAQSNISLHDLRLTTMLDDEKTPRVRGDRFCVRDRNKDQMYRLPQLAIFGYHNECPVRCQSRVKRHESLLTDARISTKM